jgi:hypothetical protein
VRDTSAVFVEDFFAGFFFFSPEKEQRKTSEESRIKWCQT